MSKVAFKQGLHFWLEHREYVIQEKRADGNLRIVDVISNEISLLPEIKLMQLFLSGELEFDSDSTKAQPKTYEGSDFSQIPENLKVEAQRKEKYIKAVVEHKIYTYTYTCLALQNNQEKLDLSLMAEAFEKYVQADKPGKVNPFITDNFEVESVNKSNIELEIGAINNRIKSNRIKSKSRKKSASSILTNN
jgi:hypothetical protein